MAASEADLGSQSEGYLDELAVPYWRAMATWYEALELGAPGATIFEEITGLLEGEAFASSLNPGHLIHYEEWLDSPIRAGSSDPIASGMVFQSDIIPTGIRPGWTANCEDTVAIGDADSPGGYRVATPRAVVADHGPPRLHARTASGIDVRDEVLPLTPTPGVLPAVLARARTSTRLRVSALDGKSVLVTGAARGIGAAVAEAVVEEGGAVALLDIDPAGADTAARLADRGSARFFPCDVRSLEEVERAVADAEHALGGLDGLVNNAGVNAYFDAVAMTEDDWDSVFAVDLKAAWMLAKAALPGLIERRGAVVNISSIQARLTLRGFFPYAAAKAGLEGLTRSLALEYALGGRARQRGGAGVHQDPPRAGVARPPGRSGGGAGRVCSPSIPLGRMAEPREIGNAVVFLLSDQAVGDHRRDTRGRLRGRRPLCDVATNDRRAPMTSTSDELRARFGAVYTAALTDVLDDLGHRHQTLPSEVVPLEPGARVAGPVFAVEGRTNHSIDPETSIRRILEMLGSVPAGHVAVYEPGDTTCAHFGELSATSLQAHGVAGVVINGGCRDVDLVRESGLPVFARYRTPQDAVSRWEVLDWGHEIEIEGVTRRDRRLRRR